MNLTVLSAVACALVADAIELHDYRDQRPATSTESLLLREADWLEMLGVVGIAREFAWGPNNLAQCRRRVLARMAGIRGRLTLPVAQAIAAQRLARMETALAQLDEESFGIL